MSETNLNKLMTNEEIISKLIDLYEKNIKYICWNDDSKKIINQEINDFFKEINIKAEQIRKPYEEQFGGSFQDSYIGVPYVIQVLKKSTYDHVTNYIHFNYTHYIRETLNLKGSKLETYIDTFITNLLNKLQQNNTSENTQYYFTPGIETFQEFKNKRNTYINENELDIKYNKETYDAIDQFILSTNSQNLFYHGLNIQGLDAILQHAKEKKDIHFWVSHSNSMTINGMGDGNKSIMFSELAFEKNRKDKGGMSDLGRLLYITLMKFGEANTETHESNTETPISISKRDFFLNSDIDVVTKAIEELQITTKIPETDKTEIIEVLKKCLESKTNKNRLLCLHPDKYIGLKNYGIEINDVQKEYLSELFRHFSKKEGGATSVTSNKTLKKTNVKTSTKKKTSNKSDAKTATKKKTPNKSDAKTAIKKKTSNKSDTKTATKKKTSNKSDTKTATKKKKSNKSDANNAAIRKI